jgi:hypothetical protein
MNTTKKESRRKGFSKVPSVKDWHVENGVIFWKEDSQTSIKITDLPQLNYEEPTICLPYSKKTTKKYIEDLKNRKKLSDEKRYNLMSDVHCFSPKNFFQIIKEILPSDEFADNEKLMMLLSKLPYLSGFEHGKELQKLLSKVLWQESSFKERMKQVHETINAFDFPIEHARRASSSDSKSINKLDDKVVLYRGFNIPANESIRDKDINNWVKQTSGESVYFSLDIKMAEWFACIQKYQFLKAYTNKSYGYFGSDFLEGKLTIAKYEIKINDLIMFDDALGRSEMECICLPENTKLIDYHFLGFDDFVNTIKRGHPNTEMKLVRNVLLA